MALDFAAGCLGGCAGVAVGHPFDTIKVKLQTQDARNPRYKGTWHCLQQTVQRDSIRGLYRGMTSPMAGVSVVNAIVFGVHGNIMKKVDNPDLLRSHMLAGATAGFLQSFISSPMELCKTRMQILSETTSSAKVMYKNPLDCLQKIFKAEGFKGIFRGQLITTTREVPGFATYFVSYEYMMKLMCPNDQNINTAAVLMAGGMAGIFSWIASYPFDVLKSRIQADGMIGESQYKGIRDCLIKSVNSEGWSVLTRGMSTTVIRAFPTNAATFAVVKWTTDFFKKIEESESNTLYLWQEIKNTADAIVKPITPSVYLCHNSNQSNYNLLNSFVSDKSNDIQFDMPMLECKLEKDSDFDIDLNQQPISRVNPDSGKSLSNECNRDISLVLYNSKITECQINQNNDSISIPSTSETHECRSIDNSASLSKVTPLIIGVNFCSICGKCAKRGAQMIFNTSNSFGCLTLRQQTLSNAL